MDSVILSVGVLGCCSAGFAASYVLLSCRMKKLEEKLYVHTRKNAELEGELSQKSSELTKLHKLVNERNKANVVALEQIQNAIRDVDEQKYLLEDTRAKLFASFKTLTQDSIPGSRVLEGQGATAKIQSGSTAPGKQDPIVVKPENKISPKADVPKESKEPEAKKESDSLNAAKDTSKDSAKNASPAGAKAAEDNKEKKLSDSDKPQEMPQSTPKPDLAKNADTGTEKTSQKQDEDEKQSEPSSLLKRKK